jgi:hypothetical protein
MYVCMCLKDLLIINENTIYKYMYKQYYMIIKKEISNII